MQRVGVRETALPCYQTEGLLQHYSTCLGRLNSFSDWRPRNTGKSLSGRGAVVGRGLAHPSRQVHLLSSFGQKVNTLYSLIVLF